MEYEVYEGAPVINSIIQFRYNPIEEFDEKKIKSLGEEIKEVFPTVQVNVLQSLKIDPKAETKLSVTGNKVEGVRFENEEKDLVLLVGLERLTLESKQKYCGWEQFSADAMKYWKLFSPHLKGLEINGISTRFTNKFELPIETKEIKKYFNVYIEAEGFDKEVNQFQMKYTSNPSENLTIHTAHILNLPIDDLIPYYLDIDVIVHEELANDEQLILSKFEILRDTKNEIFNTLITEETKKLIR